MQRELEDMPHNPERYASKELLNDAGFANRIKEKKDTRNNRVLQYGREEGLFQSNQGIEQTTA